MATQPHPGSGREAGSCGETSMGVSLTQPIQQHGRRWLQAAFSRELERVARGPGAPGPQASIHRPSPLPLDVHTDTHIRSPRTHARRATRTLLATNLLAASYLDPNASRRARSAGHRHRSLRPPRRLVRAPSQSRRRPSSDSQANVLSRDNGVLSTAHPRLHCGAYARSCAQRQQVRDSPRSS